MRELGAFIQEKRLGRGITQEELARIAQVSRHTVSNIEANEEFDPRLSSVSRTLEALGYRLSIVPQYEKPEHFDDDAYEKASNAFAAEYLERSDDDLQAIQIS